MYFTEHRGFRDPKCPNGAEYNSPDPDALRGATLGLVVRDHPTFTLKALHKKQALSATFYRSVFHILNCSVSQSNSENYRAFVATAFSV